MTDSRNDSIPSWLWVVGMLFGWAAIGQLAIGLFLASVLLLGEYAALGVTALLSVVAWFTTRFAVRRGAPTAIWVTTLLGSLPLFIMFASLMLGDFPDAQLKMVPSAYWAQMRSFLGSVLMMGMVAVAPPVTAWLAGRRVPRVVSPSVLDASGI